MARDIKVYISEEQLKLLRDGYPGFLPVEDYPDFFSEQNEENEIGRLLMFRFFPK